MLIGRGAELDQLTASVATPPAVVTIEGEAGVGKSRLVAELPDLAEPADIRLLTGACRRIREPFPLGPIIDAVRGLGSELARLHLSANVGSLRPLLPEVATWLPPAPPQLDDRAATRHRIVRGVAELIAACGPALLVLEDLHWADDQTLEFLAYLLADPPGTLTTVLTFRRDVDPALRTAAARLPPSVHRQEIELGPLDAYDTGRLAAAILDTDHVSDEFARHLHGRAGGIPLAIEELLALLRQRGSLRRRGSAWARRTLDELDVPVGIRDPVLERVAGFDAAARAVVTAAAVLQAPLPATVVLAVAGHDDERHLHAGLEAALDSGLLVEDGDLLRFRHLLAAQAVYDAQPLASRRRLHARAASALAAHQPDATGQLAHHLRHAGDVAGWIRVAEQAADEAIAIGHDAAAARLLEDVLRSDALDRARRGEVAVKLARAAVETVHITTSLTDLLADVLGRLPPGVERGELQFLLALLSEATGADPAAVRRLYLDAVDDLADRADLQAWAMMGLGIHTAPGVELADHRRWLQRVTDLLPRLDDGPFRRFLTGKAAMALAATGDPGWRRLAAAVEQATGGRPRHRRDVNAFQSIGMGACYAGHHRESQRLLTAALEGARATGSAKLELRARSASALLAYCQGNWTGLDATLARLAAELADYPAGRVDVDVAAGCHALARGTLATARQRLAVAADEATSLGALELAALAIDALIRLALVDGQPDVAGDQARRFVAALERKGFWLPATRMLPSAVTALAADGGREEAILLVERCMHELDDLDAPLAGAVLRHAAGRLAAACDQHRDAAGHLEAAATAYERAIAPYEAAQAYEQAARCRLAGTDTSEHATNESDARADMTRALDLYRMIGADWDDARATQTARHHDLPTRARHRGGRRGYGDRLSPRERQVAELAALGRTNREIAAELFLSPKTVDKHVGAALRKLGLHSRAGLAHRLTDAVVAPKLDAAGDTGDNSDASASAVPPTSEAPGESGVIAP